MLSLVYYPDPILEQVAEPIITFDNDFLLNLAADMFSIMKEKNGIGLAAPQVGISKRIFVMDCDKIKIAFINPEIVSFLGSAKIDEGCLSFPGIRVKVERKEKLVVKYQNEFGTHNQMELSGLSAICFQHELDHLDGKTFLEYLSKDVKEFIKRRLEREKNESTKKRKP